VIEPLEKSRPDLFYSIAFAGDLLLLLAGLVFGGLLWFGRHRIAEEFRDSWKRLFLASVVLGFGFVLNLVGYAFPAVSSTPMSPAVLAAAGKYGAFLLAIGLFFSGIRQWYPMLLAVKQDALARASYYRKLVQEANSVFLRWDTQGRVLSINPYGEKLFGYGEDELKGRHVIGTIVRERDAQGHDLKQMIRAIQERPEDFHHNENENVDKEGRLLWLAWRNSYIPEGLNGEPELLSVGIDITDRKRVEDALHALASTTSQLPGEENVLEQIIKRLAWAYGVEYAFFGTFADRSRRTIRIEVLWNGHEIVRDRVYALEGTPCADVLAGRIDLVEQGVAERYPDDKVLREWGVESYFGSPLRDPQENVIGIIAIMGTRPLELPRWNRHLLNVFGSRIGGELERRSAEENIYQLAHYDMLTGLPNRLLFHDRLEQALVHAARNNQFLALLFIDLDRFKHVNDTLGHAGGDILLREVAERITTLLRRSDTVARLGGDEFTILLTDFDRESDMVRTATELSQELIDVISRPFRIDNSDVYISASVGITCFPADGSNIDYLVRNADLAMYKAKEHGRNCFEFYRPELNELAERRSRMEAELRTALNSGELYLAYQPIVDVARNHVKGFEALIRWRHPEHGQVSPDEFVEIAEYNGLIVPIGRWVIDNVCRQLAEWRDSGGGVPMVSMNISLRQLQRGELMQVLEECTRKYEVRPQQLVLEITESTLMHEPDKTLPLLEELKAQGYAMAMDDFGTGYSSFGQLRQMPVRTLKIDRSFVEDLAHDENSRSIVSAIIGMGQGLGLEVIAEGVETLEQVEFLSAHGCNLMQGYHFSRPLKPDQCRDYMDKTAAGGLAWQLSVPAL